MSPDRLEIAPSGRARCRACGANIEKGAVRFGEVLPRPSGDDDATSVYWYHPRCAAHRRPEKFAHLVRTGELTVALPERDALLAEADVGIAHPRLGRLAGAERASSGRALCRQCRETIALGLWRVRLSTFGDTGFPEPLGFIHASCAEAYFGVAGLGPRLCQACPALPTEELDAACAAVDAAPPRPPASGGDAGGP
jgi:hypothetical protein